MTAYTSAASGNWDTTTNWTPNGTPGDGDTIIINGHDIDTNGDRIIGTSPAEASGTWAIEMQGGGKLTVGSGDTLQMRGDGRNNNGLLHIGEDGVGGATFEFDASQASTPASQNYRWQMSSANSQANAGVYIYGTSGSRATVRSNAGGGTGYFDEGGSFLRNGMHAEFCDFENINNPANNYGIEVAVFDQSFNSDQRFEFEDCNFDTGCGRVWSNLTPPVNSSIYFRRCNFNNNLDTYNIRFAGSNSVGTGVREIDDCYFGTEVFLNGNNWSIKGTSYGTVFTDLITNNSEFAQFDDVLIISSGHTFRQDSNRVYILNTDTSNPHHANLDDLSGSISSITLTDFTMELDGNYSVDYGDAFLATNAPDAVTITGTVGVLQDNGDGFGTLLSCLGNTGQAFTVEHNTYPVDDTQGALQVGESYNSHAGQIASLKSNIFWNPTGTNSGFGISNLNGAPVTDVLAAGNADYNNHYNLAAGSEGGGYDTPMTGSPGTNDFDVDPNFVDDTRDMASWDASLGGAGTRANAQAELAKMHLTTWNTSYTQKALQTWVRDGFKPQAQSLNDAGHDSATVGAMGFGGVNITDVNTTESWQDGDTGLVITGTGFV